jgi:predicted metal-dependent peptidase
MEFKRVIGDVPANIVKECETKLTKIILELGTSYITSTVGSGLGGDPYVFTLLFPIDHVLTTGIETAATDGKQYFWNPNFLLKKTPTGLRLVAFHEASHAILMHPMRRGGRDPKLWNIAVDYVVNGWALEDLVARNKNAVEIFSEHLGKFITIPQCVELFTKPGEVIPGLEDIMSGEPMRPKPKFDPSVPLTPEQEKDLKEWQEEYENRPVRFYADPDIPKHLQRPEQIYDYLLKSLPKCPTCGKLGHYQKKDKQQKQQPQPKGSKTNKSGSKAKNGSGQQPGSSGNPGNSGKPTNQPGGQQPGQQPGNQPGSCGGNGQPGNQPGNQPGSPGSGGASPQSGGQCGGCGCGDGEGACPTCGGNSVLDIGGLVDDHLDASESQEELYKRLANAAEVSSRMAGKTPQGLMDELNALVAPTILWTDFIRTKLYKVRQGNNKTDWNRFRSRPLFCGMVIPKRRGNHADFGCLLDTSGSMSDEDIALVVSQLQSLDEKAEGTIVPADAGIYWEDATKIKKCDPASLSRTKIVGRGGTQWGEFFQEYESKIGKKDFLVIMTDGYIFEPWDSIKKPKVDVIWVIVNNAAFTAPWGRVFHVTK